MGKPDVAEFEAEVHRGGVVCRIQQVMSDLETAAKESKDPEVKHRPSKLLYVMQSRGDIGPTAIARVLSTWGFKVHRHAVTDHRKGECRCGKP